MEHIAVSSIVQRTKGNKNIASETQLLDLADKLILDLETGKQLMDLSKPFNKVNYSLLFNKFAHHSITGRVDAWIRNFLRDHQQAIIVNGCRLKAKVSKLKLWEIPHTQKSFFCSHIKSGYLPFLFCN